MTKKVVLLVLCLAMITSFFVSCNNSNADDDDNEYELIKADLCGTWESCMQVSSFPTVITFYADQKYRMKTPIGISREEKDYGTYQIEQNKIILTSLKSETESEFRYTYNKASGKLYLTSASNIPFEKQ